MTTQAIVVYITAPKGKPAKALARTVIESRLAACVNIVPSVTSVYRWEGKVNVDAESLLIVKTRKALFSRLRDLVKKHHSYAVPEIIALPVVAGHAPYLAWIKAETRG